MDQLIMLQTIKPRTQHALSALMLCIFLFDTIHAQQQNVTQQTSSAAGAADLQKATQNPVASLISVPIQNNSNF